jgi:hypothetical protein
MDDAYDERARELTYVWLSGACEVMARTADIRVLNERIAAALRAAADGARREAVAEVVTGHERQIVTEAMEWFYNEGWDPEDLRDACAALAAGRAGEQAMTPPTRYALVPQLATQAMSDALVDEVLPIAEWSFQADYERMLAASPNGGHLTAEMLERAAIASVGGERNWKFLLLGTERKKRILDIRAALTALGVTVVDAPAGEVVDG